MRTFEIKGFWGFMLFAVVALVAISVALTIPISFIWVSWNAFVGEMFHGPMIEFWQASILTAVLAIILKLIFQPQISFQIKRVKSAEDMDKHLRQDTSSNKK